MWRWSSYNEVNIEDKLVKAPKLQARYNFVEQEERLIFIGKQGNWNQFALVSSPTVVWSEVLDEDLWMLEETK